MNREYEEQLEAEIRAIEDSYAITAGAIFLQFCRKEGIALSDSQVAKLGRELENVVKEEREARKIYKARQRIKEKNLARGYGHRL